ncbi:MAG: ribonucleoside-diphosphate reductase subunit alpha, partial [Gammaproteobacteria bacterium]|nr:ribonucleoside-diphosphate reductase subunit alpha [Gammaproteobacteria bacterium]
MATEITHSNGGADSIAVPPSKTTAADATPEIRANAPGGLRVIRRNGKVTNFDANKIAVAMTKAFLAVEGGSAAASRRVHDLVQALTEQLCEALFRRNPAGGTIHIEEIQDQVELALMRSGEHKVARAYVLYREEQKRKRSEEAAKKQTAKPEHLVNIVRADGSTQPLDVERLRRLVGEACSGLEAVTVDSILDDTCRNLFDGVKERDVSQALVMSARTLIEKEPNYSHAAARLLMDMLRREALGFLAMDTSVATQAEMGERYSEYFANYIKRGADLELLDKRLTQYDLPRLGAALKPERDLQFTYLGL